MEEWNRGLSPSTRVSKRGRRTEHSLYIQLETRNRRDGRIPESD